MSRLRPTLFLLLPAAGCAGQNVEGSWRGPFPLEKARACELRLQNDHSLTLQCDGTAIVGGGHYRWDGTTLNLDLTVLTYDGVKVQSPPPLTFKVRGEGNTMRASLGDSIYVWKRTLK